MSYSNYSEYLRHPRFLESVSVARKRAGKKCEHCGLESKTEPHHVAYCRWGDFDPPENLAMLCRSCHELAHTCEHCGEIKLKAAHIKRGVKICDQCHP
jgi:hypothetical protein